MDPIELVRQQQAQQQPVPDAAPDPQSFGGQVQAAAAQIGVKPSSGDFGRKLLSNVLGSIQEHLASTAPQASAPTPGMPTVGTGQPSQPQQPAAPPPQQTQSTGQRVLGGVSNVLSGITNAATSATDSAGLTHFAADDRAAALNQSEVDLRRAQTAKANSDMIYSQRLLHAADEKDVLDGIARGKASLASTMSQSEPGTILGADLTSDALSRMIAAGAFSPSSEHGDTAFPTGQKQTGVDKDGKPIMTTLYTAVRPAPQHIVTDVEAAKFKKVPGYESVTAGTKMTGAQWNSTDQGAESKIATLTTARYALDKAEAEDLTSQEKIAQANALKNFQDAGLPKIISEFPGNLIGTMDYVNGKHLIPEIVNGKATGRQIPDTQSVAFSQKFPSAESDLIDVYGGPGKFDQVIENEHKEAIAAKAEAETERKNREDERLKQAEIDAKKTNEVTSNLTGNDYLQTLPMAQRTMVQSIAEGRQVLPANRKEALALLEQVHQAYPDYDETKGKTWQKANNEYNGSGKTATQIVPSYNTALEHMQDLYSNTTYNGVFDRFSKAYQDREVALGYVTNEVGRAIKSGVMSQQEGQELLEKLKGGLTPGLKKERIAETARLLHDKIEEYQNKFNESAPSSAVKVPHLISPKAATSYDFVTSDGKVQDAPQQNTQTGGTPGTPQLPAGAQLSPNGALYTTDGKTFYETNTGKIHAGGK